MLIPALSNPTGLDIPDSVAAKLHPGFNRPYTFDILTVVMYAMNDPEHHANLTKTFYDRVSKKFRIIKFEEMPKYIGIEVEKDDKISHLDIEDFIRKQFGYSILNCFSELLARIPGLGTIPGGEAMAYITGSFPILNMSPTDGDSLVYQICFGI